MVETRQVKSEQLPKNIPVVYEKIIQKLEADIRGHIRLEHEMKIHMDFLEGKVEKFEKDENKQKNEVSLLNKKIAALQDKMKLVLQDRDEKDKLFRKQKSHNQELVDRLTEMEKTNSQMQIKIDQSFSMPAGGLNFQQQPPTSMSNVSGHLIGGKQKYNSIDIGYEEPTFDSLNQKNSRTNTNMSSQKRVLQPNLET